MKTIKVVLQTDARNNCFKRILKFTLKQLQHVSVLSPSSGSVQFELSKVTFVKTFHWPFKRRIKSHVPFSNIVRRFNVYGFVHRKYIPIYIQQGATLHSLFIYGNCSTCFGWYFHPSSGAHTTISTAPGICHTVTAICRYRGRVGTGLSVLWVAYSTHSTLNPVPTLPR
jgi:hypothetical protein